jgi:hypothetical protein
MSKAVGQQMRTTNLVVSRIHLKNLTPAMERTVEAIPSHGKTNDPMRSQGMPCGGLYE